MLSCATKSQPASKLGIPGLADYPLACLWLYQREINRTLFDVWHAFICCCCPDVGMQLHAETPVGPAERQDVPLVTFLSSLTRLLGLEQLAVHRKT